MYRVPYIYNCTWQFINGIKRETGLATRDHHVKYQNVKVAVKYFAGHVVRSPFQFIPAIGIGGMIGRSFRGDV